MFDNTISTSELKDLYENAYMDVSENGQHLIVQEQGVKAITGISAGSDVLSMFAVFNVDVSISKQEVFNVINRINADRVLLRAYLTDDDGIALQADINLKGGVSERNIIFTTKLFFTVVRSVIDSPETNTIFQ